MNKKTVVEKSLCYVLKNERLLVFRHVDFSFEEVGIQVPAGTVQPGETPEAAAIREAREETGLCNFKIVRKLGVVEYDISPVRYEIQKRHVFQLKLDEEAPDRWFSQEEHENVGETTRFECFWIPLEHAHVLQGGQGALIGAMFE